jgi:DNA-binding transcriptional MocR family regulator
MERAIQHELQLARRMSLLGTETAFEVLNKARALERQGKSIIHLEIGEPDFDTPLNVVEAGIDALRKGWTHYGPSAGLPELRQAIAEYVSRTRGVKITSDEVVVVPGGNIRRGDAPAVRQRDPCVELGADREDRDLVQPAPDRRRQVLR